MPRGKTDICSVCGTAMWSKSAYQPVTAPNRSGRPRETERICNPCRRGRVGYQPQSPPGVWREVTCKCEAAFSTRVHNKVWCSTRCPSRPARFADRFPLKTKEQRKGRYGRAWNRVRAQVIAEESDCWICGQLVDKARRFPDPWSPSVDHVVPLSEGGALLDRDNLRLAHFHCNRARANRS